MAGAGQSPALHAQLQKTSGEQSYQFRIYSPSVGLSGLLTCRGNRNLPYANFGRGFSPFAADETDRIATSSAAHAAPSPERGRYLQVFSPPLPPARRIIPLAPASAAAFFRYAWLYTHLFRGISGILRVVFSARDALRGLCTGTPGRTARPAPGKVDAPLCSPCCRRILGGRVDNSKVIPKDSPRGCGWVCLTLPILLGLIHIFHRTTTTSIYIYFYYKQYW